MSSHGEGEGAAALGARRAFAALSHELASPLTALRTYLRLAKGDGLGPIGACADRITAIAELARELAHLDDTPPGTPEVATDVALAIESAAARLALPVELATAGDTRALVAASRASTIATSLVRGVASAATEPRIMARAERRGDHIWARIGPAIEPATWQLIAPWESGTRVKLDLWAAAVATGERGTVRVGEHAGQLAVELELPAAESR